MVKSQNVKRKPYGMILVLRIDVRRNVVTFEKEVKLTNPMTQLPLYSPTLLLRKIGRKVNDLLG